MSKKTALDWKKDRKPDPGERTIFNDEAKFKRGLYQLADGVYAWMQPNGTWGESNSGIISSKGETLVFDSLFDLAMTNTMIKAMEPITKNAPVKYLVNGHGDGDHTYGNQLFPGAEIIASPGCVEHMHHDNPKTLERLPAMGRTLSCCGLGGLPMWPLAHLDQVGKYFRGIFSKFDFTGIDLTMPTKIIADNMTGFVGDIEYQLIHVHPAHTDADIIMYLPNEKIVYCGDVVFIDGTPACHAAQVDKWVAALDLISSLDVEYIVPGHGPIVDRNGIDDMKTYLKLLSCKVPNLLHNGMKPKEIGRELVLNDPDFRSFRLWDSPERTAANIYAIVQQEEGRGHEHFDKKYLIKGLFDSAQLAFEMPHRPICIVNY
jgi:cyclase